MGDPATDSNYTGVPDWWDDYGPVNVSGSPWSPNTTETTWLLFNTSSTTELTGSVTDVGNWSEARSFLFTGAPPGTTVDDVSATWQPPSSAWAPTEDSLDCLQVACGSYSTAYNWYFLLLLVFVAGGGLGNTLVCLAIGLDRKLQNVTNYFLLSLAVADLLVSLVVMPFSIVVGFLGYWPFSSAMCNVYVTCDVLSCSSSILHMCFISIGRYRGIRNPLANRGATTSKKLVLLKVILVWLLAGSITSPITLLGAWDADNVKPLPDQCAINNRFFFIFGSLVAFYIPSAVMVVSYVLTIQLLRQQALVGGEPLPARRVRLGARRPPKQQSFDCDNGHHLTRPRTRERGTQTDSGSDDNPTDDSCSNGSRRWRRSLRRHLSSVAAGRRRGDSSSTGTPTAAAVAAAAVDNERKASKVLGLVFSTFAVCWVPFFALNIFLAACPTCPVAGNIVDTCLWLGYASSTINPLIYTIFNRTFKEAFVRLLLCRCRQLRRGGRRHHPHHHHRHNAGGPTCYRYAQRSVTNATAGGGVQPLLLLSPAYEGRMQPMSMC